MFHVIWVAIVETIVIKPGPELTRPRGRVPGFIGQPGKIKKKLNF